MKQLFSLLIAILLLAGCKKQSAPPEAGDVWIRIENNSGILLENSTVGAATFGDVTDGQVTEYKKMEEPVYSAYCGFTKNGQFTTAGYLVCGTPPPPPFEPGYYTFKVMPLVNGFHAIVVEKR